MVRLIGIVGGYWGVGGRRLRGAHLLAISQNAPIQKCPKIPPKNKKRPKILLNDQQCPKIPQNAPNYVLQDYRGISGRADLPPIPEALVARRHRTASVPIFAMRFCPQPRSPSVIAGGPSLSSGTLPTPRLQYCITV